MRKGQAEEDGSRPVIVRMPRERAARLPCVFHAALLRMPVALIWPGYWSSSSIFWLMSRARCTAPALSTFSGWTMMRTSRPAWMA